MRRPSKESGKCWARRLALCGGLWTAPALAAVTEPSCVPSDVPRQVIVTLARAGGASSAPASDQPGQAQSALRALALRGVLGPVTLEQLQRALSERRMSADLYRRVLAEMAGDGTGPLRRVVPLPGTPCVTLQDLRRLMRGQRTAMEDPYRTPPAPTRASR